MRAGTDAKGLNGGNDELDALIRAVLAGSNQTVETSTTLPPATYTSQAFFDFEVENVFKKDWFCVGHVSQLAKVGDYFTLDLFGEMLVVVRAKDRIRVLSRVCLHRWAPVVSGEGNAKGFSCPMHGWTYALDGQLMAAPFMDKAAGFDPKSCRLPELRSEIVEPLGLIFVTFSETVDSINERLSDLCDHLANYRMNELVGLMPATQEGPYNWKILINQGMEAYHHYCAHPTTFERTHPTRLSWCEERKKGWTVCHSLASDEARMLANLPAFPDLRPDEKDSLNFYYIFPLTRMFVSSDRIRLRQVIPLGPTRTRTTAIFLLRPEIAAQAERLKQAFAETDPFMAQAGNEDHEMMVLQQAGARSSFASLGRLSHLESAAVWHLAEYLRTRIGAV